jgi:hypothetical protein
MTMTQTLTPSSVARGRLTTWDAPRTTTSDLLRGVTAAAVMLSGVIHLDLWAGGMKAVDVVGPAFLVNAIGGVVIGLLLTTWHHWVPPFLAFGFGVSTLAAFLWSTTPGGFFDVHEEWSGWAIWTCFVAEVVAVVLGLAILWVERPRPRTPR